MSITIYDVANLSGVSTATVSRVFSNPDCVRKETREKVYSAANVLHYSPNAIASSMARQRTDKIAFLICKKGANIIDEFYAGICNGIINETNDTNYQLLINTADNWEATESTNRTKQIEGVILGGDAKTKMISDFRSQGIAVVLVNNNIPGQSLPCVVSDEAGGVARAVDHLINRGAKKIAMLTGRFSPYISSERYKAFTEVMQSRGLKAGNGSIGMSELNIESAVEASTKLLNRKKTERPDAIFAANDILAAGTMKAASRLGIRIPDDLLLIGCDNSTICDILEPSLTSIRIDNQEMGRLAVQKLIQVMDGLKPEHFAETVPETLCIRGSA